MMKFLRSQSQTVLVVVLGVIGLGFLFYGNAGNLLTSSGGHVSNDYGRINGEDLSMAELSDAVRDARNSVILNGHQEDLRQPGIGPALANYAWERLLLEHEGDRLHITISNKELVDFIRSRPIFQKNGTYSPEAYATFVNEFKNVLRLPPDSGVDPTTNAQNVLESVFRNDLLAQAVRSALFNGVRSPAGDIATQYQKYYGPVTVSYATIDPKTFIATAKVTPEEIAADYKAHPENPDYRTMEQRRVDYVLFMLSPDQQKLPDAQKAAAKDALGQKALDFALAFQPEPTPSGEAPPPPDFLAQAKKMGLPAATTGFFDTDSTPAGVPPSPAFNSAAFSLSKDNPISKVVELENGVAVLHLAEILPSDLRPLDAVKDGIAKQLQMQKGTQTAKAAAAIDAAGLKGALAKGTDFKTAATVLGLKVDTLPSFVPMKSRNADERTQSLAMETLALAPGQVSEPINGQDGSIMIAHVDARGTADPAGLASFETLYRTSQDAELRAQAFTDWASWKSKQPGTHKPPDLDAFGSVE